MNQYKMLAEAALEQRSALVNTATAAKRDLTAEERTQVEALEAEARSHVEAGEREAEFRTALAGAPAGLTGSTRKTEVRSGVPFAKGQGFADLAGRVATAEEFGTFVRSLANGETRANVESTPGAGGFLVPLTYSASVLDQARNKARVITAGAQTVPMSSSEHQIAKVDGTPDAGWRSEATAIATGDMAFSAVTFKAKSLAVLVRASRELVFDAENFGEVLRTALAEAFAVKLDRAALYGSGATPEPLGLKPNGAVTKTPTGTNGAPINWGHIVKAAQAIRTANFDPTATIVAERTAADLSRFADADGQYIPAPSYVASIPILATSQVATDLTVGTGTNTSDAFVGDFRHLWVGIRESFGMQVLNEKYADTGEIAFVCHLRADIQVSRPAAFQVVTGVTAAV